MQYKGQEVVELAIKLLINEFKITMALAGYVSVYPPTCFLLINTDAAAKT
jgi:isopentenyl diphosphate isomerase/L-lactate dehydrogenase-like FMN-dependent dehydrogenase